MTAPVFPGCVVASDDAFERGVLYGQALSTQIQGSVDVYRETFAYYAQLDWSAVRRYAADFQAPIEAYDGEIMREIEGIAEGAGLSTEDVLAVNTRTEIMFGVSARTPPPECTSFFAGPSATSNGDVLVGMNWDWRTRCSETTVIAEVGQGPHRPAFVTMAEAGLIGKQGFNDHGIAVMTNALVSGRDTGEPGVPFHVILRGILNAKTLEEALDAIVRAPRSASANYLIASADGRALDVETGPGGVEAVHLSHPVDDVLCHTNHYTCSVEFTDVGRTNWPDSSCRLDVMQAFLMQQRGSIDIASLEGVLADHEGHPHSICRHPDLDAPLVEQAKTVGSWIVNLTEQRAVVAFGPPCETPFRPLDPTFRHRLHAGAE